MKISNLSIAVFALSALLFSGKTHADWGVEAYEEEVIVDDTPVWPMPYTDSYTNIDELAENLQRSQKMVGQVVRIILHRREILRLLKILFRQQILICLLQIRI